MNKTIPISGRNYEGLLATQDELALPDWRKRLARAKREEAAGKTIPLETYIARRKRRTA